MNSLQSIGVSNRVHEVELGNGIDHIFSWNDQKHRIALADIFQSALSSNKDILYQDQWFQGRKIESIVTLLSKCTVPESIDYTGILTLFTVALKNHRFSEVHKTVVAQAFCSLLERFDVSSETRQVAASCFSSMLRPFVLSVPLTVKYQLVSGCYALSKERILDQKAHEEMLYALSAAICLPDRDGRDICDKHTLVNAFADLIERVNLSSKHHKTIVFKLAGMLNSLDVSDEVQIRLAAVFCRFIQMPRLSPDAHESVATVFGTLIQSFDISSDIKLSLVKAFESFLKRKNLSPTTHGKCAQVLGDAFIDFNVPYEIEPALVDALLSFARRRNLNPEAYEDMIDALYGLLNRKIDGDEKKQFLATVLIDLIERIPSRRNDGFSKAEKLFELIKLTWVEDETKRRALSLLISLLSIDRSQSGVALTLTRFKQDILRGDDILFITDELRFSAEEKILWLVGTYDFADTRRDSCQDVLVALSGVLDLLVNTASREEIRNVAATRRAFVDMQVIPLLADLGNSFARALFHEHLYDDIRNETRALLERVMKNADGHFNVSRISYEGYHLNVELLRSHLLFLEMPSLTSFNDDEWTRLVEIFLTSNPEHVNGLSCFLDKIMKSKDAQSDENKMRNRVAHVMTSVQEMKDDDDKMRALALMIDGGSKCMDRAVIALETLELGLALNGVSEDMYEEACARLIITEFKREILEDIVFEYDSSIENIETYLYYALILNDLFGLGITSTDMTYEPRVSIPLDTLIKEYYGRLSAELICTVIRENCRFKPILERHILEALTCEEGTVGDFAKKYTDAVAALYTSIEKGSDDERLQIEATIPELKKQFELQFRNEYILNLLEGMALLHKEKSRM